MDTMYVTTVSRNILYRTATPLVAATDEAYRSAIKEVIRYYNMGGFKIDTIYCGNEHRPLRSDLQDQYGISTNFANPQEHVPEAERNIRVHLQQRLYL
jgi:hypothetical protein